MSLFKISGPVVKKITSRELDFERTLQKLFEQNLEEILNITFLAHEYSTSFGGRIDTLGIDKNGSPCIIEYKKSQNDNVINQGLSYLRWLLDHKADFEKLVESKSAVPTNSKHYPKVKIDWDSPRVICIAENYNRFDLDTADILPITIELLKYKIYDDDLLYLQPESNQKIKITTSGIIKKSKAVRERDTNLQKVYTVEEHLRKASEEIKQLFLKLREQIMSIDEDIKEEPKKMYIAYKLATNFADLGIMYGAKPEHIKIWLNVKSGQLKDPYGIARDLTKPKPVGHWGNGDYEIKVDKNTDLYSVLKLIKQSYDLNR